MTLVLLEADSPRALGNSPILIAITGWGQAEDKALSREAGFDHHLVKPVDPDALLKFIQKRRTAHTESA